MANVLLAEPLTEENFAPFGWVASAAPPGIDPVGVNEGTARRYNNIGTVQNLRPGVATLNVASFRCAPRTLPFVVRGLEKHAMSTQLFVPFNASRYVVVVASSMRGEGGQDKPNPTTLRAFLADGRQGVAYGPNVWHHTLMALDRETDFSCFVWEDGTELDCIVSMFAPEDQREVRLTT